MYNGGPVGLGTLAVNISEERETLEDVAARIGLNPVEVDDVLDSDAYADFVKFDQDVARDQLKVTGVPFFVFDQHRKLPR